MESVGAEILLPKKSPIFTGIYYRPPRQSDFVLSENNSKMNCLLMKEMISVNVFYLAILILMF